MFIRHRKVPISVLIGFILLVVIVLLVAFASVFTDYAPGEAIAEQLKRFTRAHPFGTDRYGRDVFYRTPYGGRTTLTLCFLALGMALCVDILFDAITGVRSYGLFGTILMWVIDVLMASPFMVFAIVLAALWGSGPTNLSVVVVTVWRVPLARLTGGIVLQVKDHPSILAARVLDASDLCIGLYELLPKVIGSLLVLSIFELGILILSISVPSLLGMGT